MGVKSKKSVGNALYGHDMRGSGSKTDLHVNRADDFAIDFYTSPAWSRHYAARLKAQAIMELDEAADDNDNKPQKTQ